MNKENDTFDMPDADNRIPFADIMVYPTRCSRGIPFIIFSQMNYSEKKRPSKYTKANL